MEKTKFDNKLFNIDFLLKENVFKNLCFITNCITDTSIAYIPWFNFTTTIKNSLNKEEDVCFLAPCVENNYADLSFINNGKYINVKTCRVKTLDAICMDGNILTYSKDTINDSNFIVFYSINPLETDKILIMTTRIYDFLVSNNNNEHIRYFNMKDVNKIKKTFHFSDRQLKVVDISKELEISEDYETNMNRKRASCLSTVYKIKLSKKKSKKPIYNMKTHYGHQYSAFNIINGQIRQFRDTIARNNFFNSIGVKLADNHNIIKNCKNMTKIVNGEQVESYRSNVLENGWIICEYIADTVELIKFVQKLILILKEKSKRLAERIKNILSQCKENFIHLTNHIIDVVCSMKFKLHYKFECKYFKSD